MPPTPSKNSSTRSTRFYSADEGTDLIKLTNKSIKALADITIPTDSFESYKKLIEGLYFLVHEGTGQRLTGHAPQSFKDVNDLRTALQHDIDHGDKSKAQRRRKQLGTTFKRYAGVKSPNVAAPELFPIVQLKLVTAIESDLRQLLADYS